MPKPFEVRVVACVGILLFAITGCTVDSPLLPSAVPSGSSSQPALPAPSEPPGPAVPSDAPVASVPPSSAPSTVTWSTDEAVGICKDAVNDRGALLDWSTVTTIVEDESPGDYLIRFDYQDGSPSTGCEVSGTVNEPTVVLTD